MRIVFMGTPDFAVGSLQALCESGKHEIVGVVTQPDRPKGRGNKMLMTPVKEYALEQGLTVYQPQKVKTPEFVQTLRELQPELIVVAAFGQFLSREILELPPHGCINVHASLLPKYRGAAPIQYAIIKGEQESGVTIMQMDIGMDTGAMLEKVVVPIAENTTMGELHDALREQGAALLLKVIDDIAAGTAVAEPQNDAEATYATLLDRSMEHIDWTKSAQEVHNLIRGFNPAPSTFTKLPNGKSLKICCRGRHDKHQNMSPNEGVGTESSDRVLVRKAVRSWPALGSSSPERLNASYALSMSSACFTALRVISVFIPL